MSTQAQLQLALDFANLSQALRAAQEAWEAGVRRLEAGTPLIKSEGLDCVRQLRRQFPEATIVADMKIMDAGRAEVEMAAKSGADVVAVLGAASDATIRECIEAGRSYDATIMVDLIEVADPVRRAREAEQMGAAAVGVHCPIDVQMEGGDPLQALREVAQVVSIPVAVAGGIHSESAALAVQNGASIVIVGGAIIKAPDARQAAADILQAMASGEAVATDRYKRYGAEELREAFMQVSAANISDAMHRKGWVPGPMPIRPGLKCVGPALTVWSYPGDWHKPVAAIDEAEPGSVLVVDAGGVGPAVWGEEASRSCITKGLAGIVIHGGSRDNAEIAELGFPCFSTVQCPAAGDPRGVGMIDVPLHIGETDIRTGDWVIADDDGVVVVPAERAVEIANRALDVVEREAREKAEIAEKGMTLGQVSELMRWDQQRRE
ncbi:MAG: bifunctional hexulose-6-phosphate synthase/ribonuclease regulator [candidate division WS1 bacterium]|nr:bifunctional hexulose-6-phosphate synthase/ribonuclease regulator [candidate division WS1 bacterium]